MDYIKEAFGRMNLQQMISFLLFGTDDFAEETHPYRDRLKRNSDPIYRRLESIYPDEAELDKAAADLSQALTAYEHIYMELGMKAGARLLHQLLFVDDLEPQPPVEKE
ncbi:hypothetical protein LJC27_08580 [Christensenellaceae bacterium OttesenSCG-928-M15]|nr:hypothetical protein [Christensenellaceae bacterium OttesenSCG-928-M15]